MSVGAMAQTPKKKPVMYGEPYQYMKRAGGMGLGAFAAPSLSLIIYASIKQEPEYTHPQNVLYAGATIGCIFGLAAWRNIQLAGLAMQERENLKLTLNPSGVGLFYKF